MSHARRQPQNFNSMKPQSKNKKSSARRTAKGVGSGRLVSRLVQEIPSNWCDPLLSGPSSALQGPGGTWGCLDIERLLHGIRDRMLKAANTTVRHAEDGA